MARWAERLTTVRTQIETLPRPVRVVAVSVVGGTVLLTGVAMLVLPGPGVLAILAGLALLATEFAWARRWLARARAAGQAGVDKGREVWQRRRPAAAAAPAAGAAPEDAVDDGAPPAP